MKIINKKSKINRRKKIYILCYPTVKEFYRRVIHLSPYQLRENWELKNSKRRKEKKRHKEGKLAAQEKAESFFSS